MRRAPNRGFSADLGLVAGQQIRRQTAAFLEFAHRPGRVVGVRVASGTGPQPQDQDMRPGHVARHAAPGSFCPWSSSGMSSFYAEAGNVEPGARASEDPGTAWGEHGQRPAWRPGTTPDLELLVPRAELRKQGAATSAMRSTAMGRDPAMTSTARAERNRRREVAIDRCIPPGHGSQWRSGDDTDSGFKT